MIAQAAGMQEIALAVLDLAKRDAVGRANVPLSVRECARKFLTSQATRWTEIRDLWANAAGVHGERLRLYYCRRLHLSEQ